MAKGEATITGELLVTGEAKVQGAQTMLEGGAIASLASNLASLSLVVFYNSYLSLGTKDYASLVHGVGKKRIIQATRACLSNTAKTGEGTRYDTFFLLASE